MRSLRYLENLAKYQTNVILDFEALENYMLTKGKVGTGRALDEGAKLRTFFEDLIEVNGSLPLTYTEYSKVLLYDAMDFLGIKRFRSNTNDIYAVVPLFADAKFHEGEFVYVDIRSAYYSVYKRFFNVKYLRGRYLSDIERFPVDIDLSKRVKNAIFGIMRGGYIRRYIRTAEGLKFSFVKAYQPTFNPNLVNLTYDILQAIAIKAVKCFGAIYFNTDGAVLPLKRAQEYMDFLTELGFASRIKVQGEGADIKTCNAYAVGEYQTLSYKRVAGYKSFSSFDMQGEEDWLLTLWKRKISS